MAHKLLLADDSVTIQRVIALTFAEEDVEVVTVGDGQQAIDRMDVDPPDIVLADIDMPKRDGYEVAAYVKSRPQLAHIPVVLLTGAFEPVDEARAAASGSSDVLTKPFEPQMVINRVKELLGKKRYETPGPSQTPPTFPVQPARSGPARPQAPAGETSGAATDPGAPVSLDEYFDQLDAAFANIQRDRPAAQAPAGPSAAASASPVNADLIKDDPIKDDAINDEFDWITQPPPPQRAVQQQAQPAPPAGAPNAAAAPGIRAQPPAPPAPAPPRAIAPPPPAAPPRPAPPPAQPPSPPAERARVAAMPVPPRSASPPARPAPAVPTVPAVPAAAPVSNPFAALTAGAKAEVAAAVAPAAITDEIIEDVCARVLSRLSDRVIRETVAELVSEVAERLVREEIERIKAGGQ